MIANTVIDIAINEHLAIGLSPSTVPCIGKNSHTALLALSIVEHAWN